MKLEVNIPQVLADKSIADDTTLQNHGISIDDRVSFGRILGTIYYKTQDRQWILSMITTVLNVLDCIASRSNYDSHDP